MDEHQNETSNPRREPKPPKQALSATQENLKRSYGWNGIIWNDWMNCDGAGSNEAIAEEAQEQINLHGALDAQTIKPTIQAPEAEVRDSNVVVSQSAAN